MLLRPGKVAAATNRAVAGQIWQVGERRWNVAEEKRYANWVAKNINEDFFIRHSIPVDCADVPYAIRWIYSRIAHLPAAATLQNGRLIGNWSTQWKNLPTSKNWANDRRFRAALLFMLEETSTRTLPSDTFPILINPESVAPGVVFLDNGHAGIIGHLVLDGSMYSPLQTWEASLPRKIQKIQHRSYYAGWADSEAGTGILRFRWPVFTAGSWHYLPKTQQPFYSTEQYAPGFCRKKETFDMAVARRIDPKKYDPAKKAALIINSIYHYLQVRVPLVQAGFRHCRQGSCKEGSYLWEIYSTPGRDDMIAFEIGHLLKLIKDNRLDKSSIDKTMEGMPISIGDGLTVTLKYIVHNYRWLSHDPGDSIAARWGLRKCNMIRDRMKNTLDDLNFVVKRYRSTHPEFADYHRQRYLNVLRQLQKDGQKNTCSDLPELPGS
jgi:hypothetical protein